MRSSFGIDFKDSNFFRFRRKEATVKVTADRQAPSDIIVDLILDNSSNFPENTISLPANVKIASGSQEATATVTAAPADEQPKPVTGTLASFTDVNGLMYRRVYLENVVLEETTPTDKSSFKTTISDETGTFPLHVRFKPSQALPKGTKISFTGTFDVDNGKLEIRIFKESEITSVTIPQ